MPSIPVHPALTAIALALSPASAQVPDERSPVELLAAAEQAVSAEDLQDATILLWQASRRIDPRADDSVTVALRRSIAALSERVDPLAAGHRDAARAIAEALAECAQAYARKGWDETALEIAELGSRWDRDAATKVLAYVDRKVARGRDGARRADRGSGDPDRSGLQAPPIDDLEPFFQDPGWRPRDGVLSSPALGPTDRPEETRRYFCDEPALADCRVTVDIRLGPVPAAAALAVGVLDYQRYFLIELVHDMDRRSRRVRVFHVEPDMTLLATLAERTTLFAGYRKDEFATLTVEIRGDQLECSVDGEPSVRVRLPRSAHGGYGFFVTGDSAKREPVEFRNLRFEPLPADAEAGATPEKAADAAAAAAAARSQAVLDAIAAAESDLRERPGEERVRALRALCERLIDVPSTTLRASLRARIDETCAKHDPCSRARETAFATAAERLAALATQHAELERGIVAFELYELAAEFRPDHAAAERAALEQRFASVLAARRGLPAEAEREEDNDALVAAFEHGPSHGVSGRWAVGVAGAISPKIAPGDVGFLLMDPRAPEARQASVQFRTLNGEAAAGIAFGVRNPKDFWMLLVQHGEGRSRIAVSRLLDRVWTTVQSREVRFAPEARAGFVTLAVDLDDSGVRCRVGTDVVFTVDTGGALPGRFGLVAEGLDSSPIDAMVAFRNYANVFQEPAGR